MANEDLVGFVESLSGDSHLRVQDDLGDGFVRLRAAEAQRRQAQQDIRSFEDVVLELIRNSRDAGARTLFVATWKEGAVRQLTVIDDAKGIPASHHDLVFEPFVTSKLDTFHADRWGVHGRGMALYSIRQNADEAYIAASAPGLGSSFVVRADSARLGERRDQSTMPRMVKDEAEGMLLRGPHNILRTVLEFAIDERERMSVYFGSATEIAAGMYALSRRVLDATKEAAEISRDDLPYILRLGLCTDPASFAMEAQALGLPMSERSARRIMDGDISAPPTHLQSFLAGGAESKKSDGNPGVSSSETTETPKGKDSAGVSPDRGNARTEVVRETSSVRFSSGDLDVLKAKVSEAFAGLAQDYYLVPDVDIKIRNNRGVLQISIPLVDE